MSLPTLVSQDSDGIAEKAGLDDSLKHTDHRTRLRIKYKWAFWFVIGALMIWTVVDRFTTNLWHMGVNGRGPFVDNSAAVSFFVILSWVSGRMMLVSTNVSFVTQCRVFWNWFAEVAPEWLDCQDIHQENNNIHWHTGIWLTGVSVVLHTWSVFVPYAFGVPMKIFPSWSRPTNPATGRSFSFYTSGIGVSMAGNDIWRLCTTTICFFFLLPYSMSRWGMRKHWAIAMYIHFFAAMVYTIDLIRIKSHPHCWVFNCPFIFLYFVDRSIGIWRYRRHMATIVQRLILDDKYMIVFLRTDDNTTKKVGDVYYLNFLDSKWTERAHPFTVFSNHTSQMKTVDERRQLDPSYRRHKFWIVSDDVPQAKSWPPDANIHLMRQSSGEFETSVTQSAWSRSAVSEMHQQMRAPRTTDWDVAAMIQIHEGEEFCGLAKRTSWTKSLERGDERMLKTILAWGPYRSEYREMQRDLKLGRPLVLIATGAGGAFIIDFVQWALSEAIDIQSRIQIYFSCASLKLFQYTSDVLCKEGCVLPNTTIMLHLTSHKNTTYISNGEHARDAKIQRASFEDILANAAVETPDAVVYFCGSPDIQSQVKTLSGKLGLEIRVGHSFHQ